MKTSSDPRHQKRIQLMQKLFTYQFDQTHQTATEIEPIARHLPQIDNLISRSAPNRPIAEINKIDLSILRLAVFELLQKSKTPQKVIIDEAIELGKEYGSDSSSAFINGVLGQIVDQLKVNVDKP